MPTNVSSPPTNATPPRRSTTGSGKPLRRTWRPATRRPTACRRTTAACSGSRPREGTDIASGDAARPQLHHFLAFFLHHKVPDTYLAAGIDHLSRVMDDKTTSLAFVDYKSLGVRQLGSIYEGLLEFKLKIAEEDLTSIKEKGSERVIPLSLARGKKKAEVAVKQGDIYLANDKSERKATGSYYTPDSIVQYIVANTVGPVLGTEAWRPLRPEFRTAGKTYDTLLKNAHADPSVARKKPNPHAQALAVQRTTGTAIWSRSYSTWRSPRPRRWAPATSWSSPSISSPIS